MIRLRTIGPISIQVGDKLIPATNEQIHAAILYLVAERGKPISRRVFAEMFFPNPDADASMHAGRQLVYRLRKLGVPIEGDAATISLPEATAQWDFEGVIARGTASDNELKALRAGYLSEFRPRQSDAFRKWLDEHRDLVAGRLRTVLVGQIQLSRTSRDFRSLEAIAGACLAMDPFNEEATLAAAESLAANGAKSDALQLLDQYLADVGTRSEELRIAPRLLRERISGYVAEQGRELPNLVGRDEELKLLMSAIDHSRAGASRACFVWGTAGIGKTRLLDEVCSIAGVSGHAVARVHLTSHDVGRPFAVLRELGPALLDMPGSLGASPESIAAVQGLCGHGPSQYSSRPGNPDEARAVETDVRKRVVELVDAIADEQPLVICVEDADRIDEASAQLILDILDDGRRATVLMAARSKTSFVDRLGSGKLTVIHLRSLGPEASQTVLTSLFDKARQPVDEEFCRSALRTGAGIPLFLHLLFKNFLVTSDPHALPSKLSTSLSARLDELQEPSKGVFDTVVILGPQCTVDRLELMTQLPRYALAQSLRALHESGFLKDDDASELVLPAHDLLASTAIHRMPSTVSHLLHRSAAKILEGSSGRPVEPLTIASHWESCGENDRAVRVLRAAADEYAKIGRPRESVEVLRRARRLSSTDADRREIDGALLLALRSAGEDRKAFELADALGVLEGSGSPEEILAAMESLHGSGLRADKHVDTLLEIAQRSSLDAHVRTAAAWILLAVAEDLGSFSLAKRAVDSVATVDSLGLGILHVRLIYETVFGSPEAGLRLARELYAAAQSLTSYSRFRYFLAAGGGAYRCGDTALGIEILLAAYDYAKENNISSACVFAASLLTDVFWSIADDETAARQWYATAAEHTRESNDIDRALSYHAMGIEIALKEGDVTRARDLLIQTDRAFPRLAHPRLANDRLAYSIRIDLVAGKTPDPLEVEELLKAHISWRARGIHDLVADTLFWALRVAKRGEEADSLRDDYLVLHRRDRFPISRHLESLQRPTVSIAAKVTSVLESGKFAISNQSKLPSSGLCLAKDRAPNSNR